MSDWQEIKLKTLISEMGDGGTPTTSEDGNFGGDIPWAVVEDVVPEIYKTKEYLTEKGFKRCSAKLWNEETIILTTGATIGNVGIAKVKLCTKQGITGIVCNKFADNYFLKYWFEVNINQLLRYAQGTTFKEIRTRALGNLKIKIPKPYTSESVTEQRSIASILSKVDHAIATTKNSIAKAERLKKALMQNLLTGKLKPDGTWRKEDEFYKDDKFGKVPKGWRYDKLETILSNCQYGINSISEDDGNIPMFRMNNIINGKMVEQPMVYINLDKKLFEKYKVNKGDILFNRTNSMDLVGKLGIFKLEGNYVFASYLIRLTVDDNNIPEYFNFYLNTYEGQCKLRSKATPSVSQANINAGNVKKLIVPIPPKDEQFLISSKIEAIENILTSKQTKIKKLERLKKALMQNLFSGKVRVKVPKEQLQTETCEL